MSTTTMTETGRSLLRAIIAAPDDDLPRIVYADFLDDRGDGERAEIIRVQCEIACLPERVPCDGYGVPVCESCGSDTDLDGVCRGKVANPQIEALRRRERELLYAGKYERCNWRHWFPLAPPMLGSGEPLDHRFVCRRGFVCEITCSWQDWLAHHTAILESCPIRNAKDGLARLTTLPPLPWQPVTNDVSLTGLLAQLAAEWPGVRFELPAILDNFAP